MLQWRNVVLAAMSQRQGYLDPAEADYYMSLPLGAFDAPNMPPGEADAFVEQVMTQLADQGYGDFSTNGWSITTTIDLTQQRALEQSCSDVVAQQSAGELSANDCGAILLHRSASDPSRFEVVAYVGTLAGVAGPDARPDLVSDQQLPVGSTMKGPLYACALKADKLAPDEELVDPGTVIIDDERVGNWDSRGIGVQPAAEMLIQSRNVPAARLVERLTPEGFATCLHETFGVATPLDLSLGVWVGMGLSPMPLYELAEAYTPFATGGLLVEPVMITELTDTDGHHHPLQGPAAPRQVLSCAESSWVTDALLEAAHRADLPPGVAAKTGTTNASSVAVAYTGDWVLVTWLGRIEPTKPLQQVEPAPTALAVAAEYSWYYTQSVAPLQVPSCPDQGQTTVPEAPGVVPTPTPMVAPTIAPIAHATEPPFARMSPYIDIGFAGDDQVVGEGFIAPEDVSQLGAG
jgi:penicillin-binding protein 1A